MIALTTLACTQDAAVVETLSGGSNSEGEDGEGPSTDGGLDTGMPGVSTGIPGTGDTGDTSVGEPTGDDPPLYDVAGPDGGGRPMQCTLDEDGDISGIGPCDGGPLAESFEADVQWSWGLNEASVLTIPLVANLTDDDGNGAVDLCDTPDVVVLARFFPPMGMMVLPETRIVALDGETGAEHWSYTAVLHPWFGPALGDIDGDGNVEIVAVTLANDGSMSERKLIAISNDGELEWETGHISALQGTNVPNIALADLEGDGDVEILAGSVIADHDGNVVTTIVDAGDGGFAVDLDDDGDLEYVHEGGASHHDGTPYFTHSGGGLAFPHVADVDDDGRPEVVYSQHPDLGLAVYEHDGTPVASAVLGPITGLPGAIHDMNGDGAVDLAVGHGDSESPTFSVVDLGLGTSMWTTNTIGGCCAGGTAFDFLGDATAESIFADDQQLYVFDEVGDVLTSASRGSATAGDYPVVADVDNDGSAEVVVVADSYDTPAVQVLRDQTDGWVPARRIWNQYNYHVTNIREDGTIPTDQPKNWTSLNTFRTQAQISSGGVCVPAG